MMSASPRPAWRFIKSCKQYLAISNRYADPCRFYWNNRRQVHVVVRNAFPNCNGSSAFSARVAVGSIKVLIWNKESLMWFQTCLWKQGSLGRQSQSQSHITTDGQSVCLSWCRAPSGAHDHILVTVWELLSCPLGAPSVTRGRVCHVLGSVDSNKSTVRIYKYLHFTCFTLQEYILWRNRPMRELIKFRNFKERDCATVAERCRVLTPLPSPLFAPRVSRLRGNTRWRNSKEGPRNLSDITRNSTRRCVLRMSDSSVHKRETESTSAPVIKYEQLSTSSQWVIGVSWEDCFCE
jgi:hypothetical protein